MKKNGNSRGWTLAEMLMVLALVSMLFLAVLPQFRMLQKSWTLKEASAETTQHSRVLFDHLHRQITTASALSDLSPAAQTLGYLEYLSADGQPQRYEIGADRYVYFGPPGNVSLLAGPVSRFQVSGYAPDDLNNPTSDAAAVRLVRIEAEMQSASHPGRSQSVAFAACLRADCDTSMIRVLLVAANASSLNSYERRLRDRFESWGYAVTTIDNSDSQEAFDTAAAEADIAYIPATCNCQSLGAKLQETPIGIVSEHMKCHEDLLYSNQEGTDYWSLGILIEDPSNPITSSYAAGDYIIVHSNLFGSLIRSRGSEASGLRRLARRLLGNQTNLAVIESGDRLSGGRPAPGRRVMLPWGTDDFNNSWLNNEGWAITQRAVEWAAGTL